MTQQAGFRVSAARTCSSVGSVLTSVQMRLNGRGGHGKRLIIDIDPRHEEACCHDYQETAKTVGDFDPNPAGASPRFSEGFTEGIAAGRAGRGDGRGPRCGTGEAHGIAAGLSGGVLQPELGKR